MMRTATFGGANSLDNFLARPDGSGDWLKWGKEAAQVMQHLPRVSFRSRAWSSSRPVRKRRKKQTAMATM